MKLSIENIGPIGSAVIDLTGLTVIGGLNDTGKSTIGKCLFSIVKAVRNRELEYASSRQLKVNTLASNLSSTLRRISGTSISPSFSSFIRRVIDTDSLDFESNSYRVESNLSEIKQRIMASLSQRDSHTRIIRREDVEENIELRDAIIEDFIDDLRTILTERKDEQRMYATSFENVIRNAFRNEINNKRTDSIGTISLSHNDSVILNSVFEDNAMNQMSINEICSPNYLKTPLY